MWAEEDALGGYVSHEVDVDHFAPDLVFLEGSLDVVPLAGGGGRVFPFSSVHDESGRVAWSNLFDEVGRKEGAIAEPTHDVELLWLVLGLGWPFPIFLVGDPSADVAAG